MNKSKVLVGLIIILYVLFVIFEFSGRYNLSLYFDCLMIPIITLIYILNVGKKNILFLLFLLFFTISNLFVLSTDILINNKESAIYDYEYYIANSMLVLAYVFLFVKISKSICIIHILKNFKIHIFVLAALNLYLIYVLQIIVEPNKEIAIYYFELIYNIVTLLLLSAALLNYFYRDNQKSLYLFLGVLCLVFSEVIDIAFIYVAQRDILNILSTSLSLAAFYFLYQQSKLLNDSREERIYKLTEIE